MHQCFLRACFFCSYFLHGLVFSVPLFFAVVLCTRKKIKTQNKAVVFCTRVFCELVFSVRGVYPLLFYTVITAVAFQIVLPVVARPVAGFDKFIFAHLQGSVLRAVHSYCERPSCFVGGDSKLSPRN